jgi:hypothetical protein
VSRHCGGVKAGTPLYSSRVVKLGHMQAFANRDFTHIGKSETYDSAGYVVLTISALRFVKRPSATR